MQTGSRSSLAEAAGLEISYLDFDGKPQRADDQVLHDLAEAILSRSASGPDVKPPPRYLVLRQGDPIADMLREYREWLITDASGKVVGSHERGVPSPLPCGIYALASATGAETGIRVIVAPPQAYQLPVCAEGARIWLIAVQLYGIRSERNWGHGDFTDLANLIRLASDIGAGGIGLNPLHALFPSRPSEPSPYSPSSRIYLNPLYIDVAAVPGYPAEQAATWEHEIADLRAAALVDYPRVAAVKRRALRHAYDRFQANPSAASAQDFAAFREECGSPLRRFAIYEVLCDRFGPAWREWPDRWRHPDESALGAFAATAAAEIGFVEFQQWQAHRQLQACRLLAESLHLPLGLYLDFAVGVHPDGFDIWDDPDAFLTEASVGAPPDLLNRAGQDWGLACFNPRVLQERAYTPFRQALRASMRFAGALRFDHVLGLNRLYLIPRGRDARNGAYLRFPANEMLAVMACESVEQRCLVIGEDLGTVPEGLRDLLDHWGIWTYLILLFARTGDGGIQPPADFPSRALTAFNTHDLPTFAGWWAGRDLEEMSAAGLTLGENADDREAARQALRQALADAGIAIADAPDFAAIARLMASSPSGVLSIAAEDLVGSASQPNMPGTWKEYPNWRWRLPVTLEALRQHPGLHAVSENLRCRDSRR